VLALGTKQNTATLPILVFLYEWYFFRDLSWPWLKRSLTVALPAAVVVGAVALVYLGDSPWERLVRGYGERDFTMGERLLTQPRVLMLYLGLVAWPLPSRLSLTHDISTSHSLLDPATTFASVLVVIALLISVVLTARRHRIVSFCIAWVLLHLSIESSVVPLEMAYEHRMYLPMLGVSLLVAWAVFRAVRDERRALVVIGGLVLALTFATQQRNRVWQDTRSVWNDVLAKYPNDVRAYNNLGDAHEEAGDFVAALAAFDNAIRINPIYQKAYVNRGVFYASQGKTIRALEDLSRAIDIDPEHLTWWPVYGEAHQNRGAVYMQLGKYEPAIEDLTRAIELDESDDMAYSNRSVANAALGRFDSAVRDGRRAVELNPKSASARNNLAWILATARDPEIRDGDDSVRHATRACELTEWKDAGNLDTLAAAHAEAGDFDSAIRVTRQALETVRASGGAPELIAVFQAHLAAFESNEPLRYP
jgi:tetratricopeptide (TPR) repeat protein